MNLDLITPLILTFNEASNIKRTIDRLTWANRIVVIDSGSTDETLNILANYSNVEVLYRSFDTHQKQWNFGLSQIHTEWVLTLDADYQISLELIQEIRELLIDSLVNGYFISFRYCVLGKPLRGTILPPRLGLFRHKYGFYKDDGHTQLLELNGRTRDCKNVIYHDDRKPLSRWLWSQDRYIQLEVQKLINTPNKELSTGDRIRKMRVIAPFAILFYCLILKGCIFDGLHGWFYAFQRLYAELLLSLRLLELDLLDIATKEDKPIVENAPPIDTVKEV